MGDILYPKLTESDEVVMLYESPNSNSLVRWETVYRFRKFKYVPALSGYAVDFSIRDCFVPSGIDLVLVHREPIKTTEPESVAVFNGSQFVCEVPDIDVGTLLDRPCVHRLPEKFIARVELIGTDSCFLGDVSNYDVVESPSGMTEKRVTVIKYRHPGLIQDYRKVVFSRVEVWAGDGTFSESGEKYEAGGNHEPMYRTLVESSDMSVQCVLSHLMMVI